MAKTIDSLDDDVFFTDHEGSGGSVEPEHRVKESKRGQPSRVVRQRLDSLSEELWLKQQLSDWDDTFEDETRAD